ncbi:MAG: hypothetical protein ABSH20_04630 [Tepidisphaeraceae bacterium]|jgi:SRSO17 transposase
MIPDGRAWEMRARIQKCAAAEHTHPQAVGIVDETSFVKKGKKTRVVHLLGGLEQVKKNALR